MDAPKSWMEEMTHAYEVGIEDGLSGKRRGRPNDFEACYQQGYEHGARKLVRNVLDTWDQAREKMAECLNA
jgi:hypothetical protein